VNQIDVVLLFLLLPFALRGYWRGFLREGFALVGLVGGVGAAIAWRGALAAALLARGLSSPAFATPAAVTILFVAVYVTAQLAGAVADRLARAAFLGGVNRAVGVAFGLAKGATLLGVVLALLLEVLPSPWLQRLVAQSRLGAPLVAFVRHAVAAGRSFTPPASLRQRI
jgi:membrane protein required for colicin V production